MARDRKRAKQRQQRRAKAGALPPPAQPRHENVPGSLEHASGEVQEFDAALIAGAQGQVSEDDPAPTGAELDDAPGANETGEAGADVAPEPSGADYEASTVGGPAPPGREGPSTGGVPERRQPLSPTTKAGADGENRVLSFLRASWSELQRVQWPDRRQVFQATAVVLGFVAIAGAYLGLADFVASKFVDAIL